MARPRYFSLWALLLVLAGWGGALRAAELVRPSEVISKAGCNQGVCHGNQNGKGGLKLSLRGQNPDDDFATLARDFSGRRTDRLEPDQSLILLKPALRIAHEGGRRFTPAAPEYALLWQWIAAGMPRDPKATPQLVRLEVQPREQILLHPVDRIQLHVKPFGATHTNGHGRPATLASCTWNDGIYVLPPLRDPFKK